MLAFILRRVGGGLATLILSSLVVFSVIHLVPGDPIATAMGTDYNPAVDRALRQLYGLNRPLVVQYWDWLTSLLRGNFGYSLTTKTSVWSELSQRMPRTLILLAGGVVISLVIAVPAGILAARFAGGVIDRLVVVLTSSVLSVPQFWVGLLLIGFIGVKMQLLPAGGYYPFSAGVGQAIKGLILPWITIALPMSAFIARTLRSSMMDVVSQNYVRTARSRGLSERSVVMTHVLRNASIPVTTVVGLEIGGLLGGAIIVEQVFSYPGMGNYMVNAVLRRDYPVLQASALLFTFGFILVNVVVDLVYGVLDPRIRVSR
ncbi:MAG TPA: ABC transporter permease [Jatrophihabitans sp.]|jgi:peptide/nickel transport system permease protein